jgi:hypothetical protein
MSLQPTNDRPVIKLEVEVTAETSHDLDVLIAEEGWERDDGLRIILGAGLGAVRSQRFEQARLSGVGAHPGQNIDNENRRFQVRLLKVEQSLAVLRFKLFEAQQANTSWELSTGAIRNENLGLRGTLERQRNELSALNDRVRALENENAALKSLLGETHEQPAVALTPEKPPSARQYVFKRIKRWVDSKRD